MRITLSLAVLCLFTSPLACADGMDRTLYSDRADVRAFITELARNDGFDIERLADLFAGVEPLPRVLELIKPPATPKAKSWRNYRAIFVEPKRVAAGRAFMAQYATPLARAEARYGVPREIIAAIIGVETLFGGNTGSFNTLAALTTLAFDYPPRANLFRRELRALLLLARDTGRAPDSFSGSFAGALGLPQFLPSSWRQYAVDFDGSGVVDLGSSAEDAIGSVGNYLAEFGWQRDQPIAVRVNVSGDIDGAVARGIEPALTPTAWQANGLVISKHSRGDTAQDAALVAATAAAADAPGLPATVPDLPAALIDLPSPDAPTEYRLGYRNFYVITRYNHSSNYAAAVMDLAAALQ